jgi:hypothetical protein
MPPSERRCRLMSWCGTDLLIEVGALALPLASHHLKVTPSSR